MDLLNNTSFFKFYLSKILYSPKAIFTLVSIGWLVDVGFSTTFVNRKCIIHDISGSLIAEIFQNGKELYKLVRELKSSKLLYYWSNYIIPSAAQELICNGSVTSLKLEDKKDTNIFYESCTYKKKLRY